MNLIKFDKIKNFSEIFEANKTRTDQQIHQVQLLLINSKIRKTINHDKSVFPLICSLIIT